MTDIISWIQTYSPPVVMFLLLGGAFLYLAKQIFEKSISAQFAIHAKELELALERRSAFKDKVLTERYALVAELSARLEKIMTNLNRIRHGQEIPPGFRQGVEIVPLTEIFEDLEIHRLVLTEDFYDLFRRKANLALTATNIAFWQRDAKDDDSRKSEYEAQWQGEEQEWLLLSGEFRQAVEKHFKLSEITM